MITWSRYQKEIFTAVSTTQDSLVIEAVAGSGKCLGRGTPVLLHNGNIKRVEEVRVGETLMGPDSKARNVLSVTQGRSQLYRIVPKKGEPWVCNDAHILVLTGTNRFRGQTLEISVTDYFKRLQKQRSFRLSWKLWRTSVDFPEALLTVEPYLVGLWLGDGTNTDAIFSTMDHEIVSYLWLVAPKYGCECCVRPDKTCLNVRLRMGARGIGGRNTPSILRRLFRNECRDEMHNKIIPQRYLIASREQRLQLLAGLIDTDGSLSNGVYDFVSKYRAMALQVVYLCRSLGFSAAMTDKHIGDETYYRICISGELSEVPCLISRKQAKARKQIKRVNVTDFTVEPVGSGNYYGFTLDGDGRFLLGDFTVTHNTTTIVEAIRHVPLSQTVLFCAFNKAIADTLKGRVTSPNATCATLHSLGLRAWQSFCGGGVRVEGRKSWEIAKEMLSWEQRKDGQLVKLVGLAKQHGMVPGGVMRLKGRFLVAGGPQERLGGARPHTEATDAGNGGLAASNRATVSLSDLPEGVEGCVARGLVEDTDETWMALCDTYDIDSNEVDLGLARQLLKESLIQGPEVVDYDDMLWLPIVCQAPFPQFDVVFCDEIQDVSSIQGEMIARMVKAGVGRVIGVGDRKQSIYAFRGAGTDAMDKLSARFQCRPLPLSISYRCPKAVVNKAKTWVDQIEPAPDAPEGLVVEEIRHSASCPAGTKVTGKLITPEDEIKTVSLDGVFPCTCKGQWLLGDFRPSDVVLCRLTRPLVALAFRLIRARIACRVLGRDIGQGLIKLIEKAKLSDSASASALSRWLDAYEERETKALKAKEEWGKIGLLHDKCETLRIFTADARAVADVKREIEGLFRDAGGSGMVLSTIHKAKGLEWPRVFILDSELYMPPPWATDLASEANLAYVACTRSQQELYYLKTEGLK